MNSLSSAQTQRPSGIQNARPRESRAALWRRVWKETVRRRREEDPSVLKEHRTLRAWLGAVRVVVMIWGVWMILGGFWKVWIALDSPGREVTVETQGSSATSLLFAQSGDLLSKLRIRADTSSVTESFTFYDPPMSVSIWYAVMASLVGVSAYVAAMSFSEFISSVNRGKPFGKAFKRFAIISSASLVVGEYLAPLINPIISSELGTFLVNVRSNEANGGAGLTERESELFDRFTSLFPFLPSAEIPMWPLGVIILLNLLTVLFSYAQRLQDDTEGLV